MGVECASHVIDPRSISCKPSSIYKKSIIALNSGEGGQSTDYLGYKMFPQPKARDNNVDEVATMSETLQ